jgi:hypothetical protein
MFSGQSSCGSAPRRTYRRAHQGGLSENCQRRAIRSSCSEVCTAPRSGVGVAALDVDEAADAVREAASSTWSKAASRRRGRWQRAGSCRPRRRQHPFAVFTSGPTRRPARRGEEQEQVGLSETRLIGGTGADRPKPARPSCPPAPPGRADHARAGSRHTSVPSCPARVGHVGAAEQICPATIVTGDVTGHWRPTPAGPAGMCRPT